MITRRDWLKLSAAAGVALSLTPRVLEGLRTQSLITRAIPSTGERIPVVGLGSSATFASVARTEDVSALREVLQALVDGGGAVFDTAPSYGASEEVAAALVNELGVGDRVFWATKLNVAGRGDGRADLGEARAQVDRSFERIRKEPIDLIQVHNLGDPPTQLAYLREVKAEGRLRYIGITSTSESRYPDLAEVMRTEPLDFIGVDYAVDNRAAAELILPLAQDRGIAVLNYAPFGRTRLWNRTAGLDVPEWAREFGAETWAQFFLKYVISNPAVTAATPATSRAANMIDNLGGAMGELPDEATRRRMESYVDALPSA